METRTKLIQKIQELEKVIIEQENELEKIKQTLIICANCHNIRDKQNDWHPVADFINSRFKINFSHGICPKCAKKLYPDFYD